MAIVANTRTTYGTKGIREELSDIIYNISPEDTPFVSRAGKEKVEHTFFEHMTDSLAAVDTANAQLEGDDVAAFDASNQPTRVGNYVQISRKTLVIAGTTEAVNKAGRKSEKAYQRAKKGAELKRDMEAILIGTNQGGVTGDNTTARKTATLLAWVRTNTSKEGTGAEPAAPNPYPAAGRTDGATRAFTETILKDVVQKVWTSGGSLKTLMVGGLQKQVVSGFSGIATKTLQRSAAAATAIVAAADIYVSDFGTLEVVPNRFQRNRDAWLLDFDYISVATLRPFKTELLAKTGDAEKEMMLVEYGLKVKQEAALGLAADLS